MKNNYFYLVLVGICGLAAAFLIYQNKNIAFTNEAYAYKSGDFCDDGTPVGQCSGVGNPGTKGQPYKCVQKSGPSNILKVDCFACGQIGTNQCVVSQCYYQAYPHEPQNSGCYEKTNVIFAEPLESQTEVENINWNNLTYAGGSFAPGKFGYAYLPGASGHLVFHLSENNMNGKPFYGLRGDQGTLELWVNPQTGFNQPDKKSVFLDENLNSDNRFSLYYKNNNIYFERAGQGDEVSISQGVNWSVNSWHQILTTYGAQGSKLYIDGNLTSNPSVNGIGNFANNVYIGSDSSGNNSAAFYLDYLTFYGYQKTDLGICSEIPAIDYQCPAISTVNRIKIDFTTTASHSLMDILNNARLDNVKIDTNVTSAEVHWNFDHQLLEISNNSGTVSGSLTAIVDQINDSQPIIFNTGKTCDGNFSVTIYNYNTNSPIAKLNHSNNKTSNCDVDHISLPATDLTSSGPYQTVSQTSPVDHLVWAYYYTWYADAQNDASLSTQDILPAQKALTGHYNSSDPNLIRAHIQAAKAHGIDGFAVAADFSTNNDLVNNILTVAQEENFKIAPSPYIGDDNGQTIPELVNGGLSFFQHYGNDNRLYSVDGKKVIFWWVTTPYDYQQLRTQVFDVLDQAGYHGFNVSMIDGTMNSLPYIDYNSIGNYAQGANLSNADYYNCAQGLITKTYNLLYGSDQTVISMPTITPGGNENVISFIQPYRAGIYRDRCDGGTLNYLFDTAIQSKPDWLMITSWNEFPEHTHIEPDNYMSVNYLNMITDYSVQLKAQSVPPPSTPTITLSVNSLSDFGNVAVGNNSAAKNYTVSGGNLTTDITITAPENFQVSQDNNIFSSSIILTKSGTAVSTTTVYARFSPGSTGIKSGNITHSSTGATTQNVAVSGTGITPVPTINLSVNSLPDFGSVIVGNNSPANNYTISGSNLTADITITAPANFQVSLNNNTFSSSIVLTKSGSAVATTTVYARFSPGSTGVKSGNITHVSTGAVTQNVAVSGTGIYQSSLISIINLSVNSLPDFGSVIVGNNSTAENYTVSGSNLTADITITAPANFQVSQNNINFSSSIILAKSGLVVPTTTVYARFSPNSAGSKSGNITQATDGATTQNVAVSGIGTSQSTPPPPPPPVPPGPGPTPPAPIEPFPTPTTPIITPEPTIDPLSPLYLPAPNPTAQLGRAVKLANASTIYYLSETGHQRYAFPNPTVFNSWYYNFDNQYKNVEAISLSELQTYPLVGNVTMRPGTKLIKIPSNPKVYVITPDKVLHWIINEQVFNALGYNFSLVVDVPDILFQNYVVGNSITTAVVHPAGTLMKYSGSPTVYYFDGSVKRPFASEYAFYQNKFYWMHVLTVSASYNYPAGPQITAMEPNLRLSW